MKELISLNQCSLDYFRAGGPGGQKVNKTSSAVRLTSPDLTEILSVDEVDRLLLHTEAKQYIRQDGEAVYFVVECRKTPSQMRNREYGIKKMNKELRRFIKPPKLRKETKKPKKAVEKRLYKKKMRSKMKSLRKNVSE